MRNMLVAENYIAKETQNPLRTTSFQLDPEFGTCNQSAQIHKASFARNVELRSQQHVYGPIVYRSQQGPFLLSIGKFS